MPESDRRRLDKCRKSECARAILDDCPGHHHPRILGTGPFDIGDRDFSVCAALYCGNDTGVQERVHIAFALQPSFDGIDAGGDVDRQHKLEIDKRGFLGRMSDGAARHEQAQQQKPCREMHYRDTESLTHAAIRPASANACKRLFEVHRFILQRHFFPRIRSVLYAFDGRPDRQPP